MVELHVIVHNDQKNLLLHNVKWTGAAVFRALTILIIGVPYVALRCVSTDPVAA